METSGKGICWGIRSSFHLSDPAVAHVVMRKITLWDFLLSKRKWCKSHFLSLLPSPYLSTLAYEGSLRHLVALCASPDSVTSFLPQGWAPLFLFCSDKDVRGRIWVVYSVQTVPDGIYPPLSWSFCHHGLGLKVKDWKKNKRWYDKTKIQLSVIFQNVIPLHIFSQKQNFWIPFKSFITGF